MNQLLRIVPQLPDSDIRFLPCLTDVVDDDSHYIPVVLRERFSVAHRLIDALNQLVIYIELLLFDRRIANSDGCRVPVARKMIEYVFLVVVMIVQPIQWLDIRGITL
nr:hypothetical protein [Halococcus sediminicola]